MESKRVVCLIHGKDTRLDNLDLLGGLVASLSLSVLNGGHDIHSLKEKNKKLFFPLLH